MTTVRIDGARAPMGSFVQNSGDSIPVGTELLGKYSVERTLGKGGMGVVVAARHHRLGELHAIKFLLPNVLVHRQAVQRFEREARAAARLRSEHVARVMDVGRMETGEPYMIMEYLEGQDMRMVLRDGPLPIADAIEYLVQVCDAVAEAHRAGIVHRDLKPANLFLTTRPNGSCCIKVLDFGIAKIADPTEVEITNEGMIGSLKYMSPEQIRRSRTADWRTDIWAIGMIGYELLTAKVPFVATSNVDLISNIFDDEPAAPSTLRADLPAALEAVILKCLRKDREERFQSVDELAEALRTAAGLPPTHVRAAMASISMEVTPTQIVEEKTQRGFGVTDHSIPRPRLHRSLVAGGAVAAIGTILVLAMGLRRSVHAPASRAETPQVQAAIVPPGESARAPIASAEEPVAAPTSVASVEPAAEVVAEVAVEELQVVQTRVIAEKPRQENLTQDAGVPVVAPVASHVPIASIPSAAEVREVQVAPAPKSTADNPDGSVEAVPVKTEPKIIRMIPEFD